MLKWSDHGNVMVFEVTRRPPPLTPKTRNRVASAVSAALVAAGLSAILLLLGHTWGGYLLVIPIIVFGMIFWWSQRRNYHAVQAKKTVGVSPEVVRVHSLVEGAGVHELSSATRIEAERDQVIARTGDDELVLFRALEEEDAEEVATAITGFVDRPRD